MESSKITRVPYWIGAEKITYPLEVSNHEQTDYISNYTVASSLEIYKNKTKNCPQGP